MKPSKNPPLASTLPPVSAGPICAPDDTRKSYPGLIEGENAWEIAVRRNEARLRERRKQSDITWI